MYLNTRIFISPTNFPLSFPHVICQSKDVICQYAESHWGEGAGLGLCVSLRGLLVEIFIFILNTLALS